MPKSTKPSFVKHAEVCGNWFVRPNGIGGLKLTYNAYAGNKKINPGIVIGSDAVSNAAVIGYKDKYICGEHIGVESDISHWSVYDDLIYVKCSNGKIYRLLMSCIHYMTRVAYNQSRIIGMLEKNNKVSKL
jgi:hypothetical protein